MKLIYKNGVFLAICTYEEHLLPKEAKFVWNKHVEKKWTTTDVNKAASLVQYAEEDCRKEIQRQLDLKKEVLASSYATSADIKIPVPEGLAYLPFQKAGIEFMLNRKEILLADEMGCIDGDTIIHINRAKAGFSCKVEDAYRKFNHVLLGVKEGWDHRFSTYTRSLCDGEFRLNKVKAIIHKGKKQTFRIETKSGKALTLTSDHEILTESGKYKALSELKIGDQIIINGQAACSICKTTENIITYFVPKIDHIKSISPSGERDVYDMVVSDPNRNFVANGIVVHNCGKTIEVIGLINLLPELKNILVICPLTLKRNWEKELKKWLTRKLTIKVLESKESFPKENIVIIHYNILQNYEAEIRSLEWDLLAIDEAHLIKNPETIRAKQVVGYYNRKTKELEVEPIPAKIKIPMTGTPIVNRPKELFPILHYLQPNVWKNYFSYGIRYCAAYKGRFGWDFDGSSNLEELQERLRSTIMIRRKKEQVLLELPAKFRQVIELPPDGLYSVIKMEQEAYEKNEERLDTLKAAIELAKASDDPEEYKNAVKMLAQGAREVFEEISQVRHATAVAKIPYIIEHLTDLMEEGNKLVFFAHHHDVINAIESTFPNISVTLTGQTKKDDRVKNVEKFQNDPNCKIFIGSIKAAGVGITLTASSHCIFGELDWVPGEMSQAEDRLHRIGQHDSVLVQHLVLEGSLDARMACTLIEKQEIIDKTLDKEITKYNIALPEKTNVSPVATKTITQKQIETEALSITTGQINAIHHALRILAGYDTDKAIIINDIGFNKLDVRIGHQLAMWNKLTPKQAILGKKIILKYWRQLPDELLQIIKGG